MNQTDPAYTSETIQEHLQPLVLTKGDVAILLQVGESTVENLHRVGQLPGVKIGKHLRWRLVDVQAFVRGLRHGELRA